MTSPGKGAAYAAIAGLAAGVVKEWRSQSKARSAIIRLFQQCLVDDRGRVLSGPQRREVAGLVFEVQAGDVSSVRVGRGRQVTVTNTTLLGDNPQRIRTFRYWDRMWFPPLTRTVPVSWAPNYIIFVSYPK